MYLLIPVLQVSDVIVQCLSKEQESFQPIQIPNGRQMFQAFGKFMSVFLPQFSLQEAQDLYNLEA